MMIARYIITTIFCLTGCFAVADPFFDGHKKEKINSYADKLPYALASGLLAVPLVVLCHQFLHSRDPVKVHHEPIQKSKTRPGLLTDDKVIRVNSLLSDDQIINKILSPVDRRYRGKNKGSTTMYFVGGTTGAGRSTVINHNDLGFPGCESAAYIDNDSVKPLLPDWDPKNSSSVHLRARQVTDAIVDKSIKEGMDMVVQGSGTRIEHLQKAKKGNYRIRGHFIWIPDDLAEQRTSERNRLGLRVVPHGLSSSIAADIRYSVKHQITDDFYDSFKLWDNRGNKPELIASYAKGEDYTIKNHDAFYDFFGGLQAGETVKNYWQKHAVLTN